MKNQILKRAARFGKFLTKEDFDAFVVFTNEGMNWESLYYTTGFRGTSGAAVLYRDHAVLITDPRYITQAHEQSPLEIVLQKNSLYEAIEAEFARNNVRRAFCESDKTYNSDFRILRRFVEDLRDGSNFMRNIRRTKDETEVAFIRKSADLAAEAFMDALSIVKPGMTEKEFEAYLNYRINMLGAEAGFEMIVASGERGAMPHGRATDKKIEKGELVTVDYGARYNGYFCDITRNFSIGEPADSRVREYHDYVLQAHQAGANVLRADEEATLPHIMANDMLEAYNLSKYFTHSLGHSFGLEVHEPPFLSPRMKKKYLKAGDIVTVEPGIYIPGWGGMRIEDDYLVTEDGAERLTDKLEQKLFIV